ncbi:low affinity iron permease family protein [Candidatus Kaiserbacteria bacterium]|nr:low affinity iron permease family protein [Candidatus Kaiserbacteria bacterium]
MNDVFRKAAHKASQLMGSSWAFAWAFFIIVIWALCGPIFHFSDTWQLIINTGTTVLTFLMVFLIQNTQNRDAHAIHLKLDELIKANDAARNILIDAEDMTDEELDRLKVEFRNFCEQKGVLPSSLEK